MIGHLHLTCQARDGRTVLSKQSFRAPVHLSKPYWDGSALIVNVVNPTAGYFGGDEVDVRVRVQSGARAVITSPSATRIYQAREGQAAMSLCQHISVCPGGWLDWCPEMTVAHKGSRCIQQTTVDLQQGAGLFFMESLAPGRVAHGESFAFDSLRSSTCLHIDGKLTLLERYQLSQTDDSLHPLRSYSDTTYHSTGFLLAPQIHEEASLANAIAELSDERTIAGASQRSPGVWVIKILTRDSLALHRVRGSLRTIVYQRIGLPQPALRKL